MTIRCLVLFLIMIGIGPLVLAQGPTVLTVSGAITAENGKVNFDMATLETLDPITLHTHTPWTDGVQSFTGVLISRLLKEAGAQGGILEAIALNNYKSTLTSDEVSRYPVIIAFDRNGEPMPVRDKGPLWIIYPLDDYPELQSLETEQKMVWQLRRLIVK